MVSRGSLLGVLMVAALLVLLYRYALAPDVERGARLYSARCAGCHALQDNGPGPRHAGLLGRRAGTQPGYRYSAALRSSGIVWTEGELDRWLQNPNAVVPGNRMVVRLMNDAAERADVIAWLRESGSKWPDHRQPQS
jgi:cytochrome c